MVDNTTQSALQGSLSSASSLPHRALSAPGHHPLSGGMKLEAVMENLQRQQAARLALEEKLRSTVGSQIHRHTVPRGDDDSSGASSDGKEDDVEEHDMMNEEELSQQSSLHTACPATRSAPMYLMARVPSAFTFTPARRTESPSAQSQQQHDWTYEEQFKQVNQQLLCKEPQSWFLLISALFTAVGSLFICLFLVYICSQCV